MLLQLQVSVCLGLLSLNGAFVRRAGKILVRVGRLDDCVALVVDQGVACLAPIGQHVDLSVRSFGIRLDLVIVESFSADRTQQEPSGHRIFASLDA